MLDIPLWIQYFFVGGVLLILVAVPARILWEATRESRERRKKRAEFVERLKERFAEVRFSHVCPFGDRISFRHEGAGWVLRFIGREEILLRIETMAPPAFPVVARSRGGIDWPFVWEEYGFLPRVRTHDPLLDEAVRIYARPHFGAYLAEAIQAGQGGAESLVVLRRAPRVRAFELRMSPSRGFSVRLSLRTEDILYRPDELESVVHHAAEIYGAWGFLDK